jgi:hypothetical protein
MIGGFYMKLFRRDEIVKTKLPGRTLQVAVGKEAVSKSEKVMVGFAHYSAESGPMEPHQHVEEAIYVLNAQKGWFRYGPTKEKLGDPVHLEGGMILHFPPWEWHVFEYGENGYIDIIFIYGQVENIYPQKSK